MKPFHGNSETETPITSLTFRQENSARFSARSISLSRCRTPPFANSASRASGFTPYSTAFLLMRSSTPQPAPRARHPPVLKIPSLTRSAPVRKVIHDFALRIASRQLSAAPAWAAPRNPHPAIGLQNVLVLQTPFLGADTRNAFRPVPALRKKPFLRGAYSLCCRCGICEVVTVLTGKVAE